MKLVLHAQSASALLAAGAFESVGQDWHVLGLSAPAYIEYLPESQLLHAASPDTVLYVPATHSSHVPPLGPVAPALQAQALIVTLSAGECDLSGQ